ncbi:SDR family NAD(P)-dependent oxidoreductase [Sphingobium nicotianae]|uniref:SDR family NAD(P)-dependent oxidoreductase n=1 Tax=Sphingobium nicotianae TaxID=2782607 RepID=A0A9X1DDA7_9SPHN|nr:SDR family NAD(P)-dependent oxidoreductase [Sphingobium nicotianae]MBT2187806.1 SDR family NAD(P)-dependent oxidoreductase [Sphingobium nicotianae]
MADGTRLDGRAALITGSVGGLGYAMARHLARAGASIVLTSLDAPETAEPQRAALAAEAGVPVHYIRADLTDRNALRALVGRAQEVCGAIDILVNNAVVRHFAPVEEFPLEAWDRALAVNLSAALIAIQLVLPAMRARGYGRIFNMTSVYGSRATVQRVDYVTTKTALQGLTRAVALETAGSPVSCHALTPGSVLTPIWDERVADLMAQKGIGRPEAEALFLDGKQPSGTFVSPDSVAQVMLMLCGPVGPDMNGAIVPIEGGWLANG